MPDDLDTPRSPETPRTPQRKRHVPGRLIVGFTLSLLLIVPLVTATLAMITEPIRTTEVPPLVWADRQEWRAFDVRYKAMMRGLMSAARTNEKYRDFGFHPTDAQREQARRANALAVRLSAAAGSADPAGAAAALLPELEALVAAAPEDFHSRFVLAQAQRITGNTAESEAELTRAFDLAPAALVQRYTLPTTQLASDYRVDDIVLGIDEVVDDAVQQDFTLRYPALRADDMGQVYLPVPQQILRVVREDAPTGDNIDATPWFTFPPNIGRLPTEVAPVTAPPVRATPG